jgi:hypothetical protein
VKQRGHLRLVLPPVATSSAPAERLSDRRIDTLKLGYRLAAESMAAVILELRDAGRHVEADDLTRVRDAWCRSLARTIAAEVHR